MRRSILLFASCLAISAGAAAGAAADPLPPGDRPAPTAQSRLADAGVAADHPGADHVVVYEHLVNRVKPSGVTDVDGYRLLKVLTAAGCRDLSVLAWPYDPRSQHLEVREVHVLRGAERIGVDLDGLRDLPAPQAAIYWRDRLKTLQLPRLQVGDGIEIVTFRKGYTYALLDAGQAAPGSAASAGAPDDERYIPPMPGEYFDIVLFQDEAPVVEKRYELVLPAAKRLHAEVYNGPLYASVTYDQETTTHAWWCRGMPARPREPSQPDASDLVPKVVMATVASWQAKSRWFFEVNRDQFEVTPAIQAKVDEILREAGVAGASDERRAKALLHWVAQNIRYSGQTMGEGEGFTLHPAPMIFAQRSGVCKDIAGMLVAMLRAAGLDSYAAMTMAGSRVDAVPADQFNHCVTALRLPDGTFRMYDPTWVPYNNDIWSKLETEQEFLIGTPAGETLDRIPYSPPQESPLLARHEATLADDGTLSGRIRLSGGGASDSRLRRLVNGMRRQERQAQIARLLGAVGDRVEVVAFAHRAVDDFGGDMWLDITYRIPRFVTEIAGAWELTSPLLRLVASNGNLFNAGSRTWAAERQTDLLIWFTQLLDAEETIRLPRGWRLAEEPELEAVDRTYAAYEGRAWQDGRTLKVTARAEVRRRQIPPAGYPGFKQAMDAAAAWRDQALRLTREGK